MARHGRVFPVPFRQVKPFGTRSSAIVTLTGTITTAAETDIVAGGRTIILTLVNDTWVASGGTFDGQRANIIAGLTSAQSEALGWNNVVKVLQGVAGVVRTSDYVVTITLDAQATYDITATETVTVTVPATALNFGIAAVASPTFNVTATGASSIVPILLTQYRRRWAA